MSWSRNRELFTTTRLLLPSSVVVYALELKPSKQPSNSEFSIVPLFRKSFSTQSSRMNLKYAFRTVQSASPCASMLAPRSEEHTSELQSQSNLVCRLLLEKKKNRNIHIR